MVKTSSKQSKAARSIRMACGFLFILFSVIFLLFQSHSMEMLQKVLSDGQTTYSSVWGTCIITVVLCLIQMGVSRLIYLPERVYALSYGPSLLLLAFITDMDRDVYQGMTIGRWAWIIPVGLILFGGLAKISAWLLRLCEDRLAGDWFSRCWFNVMIFVMLGCTTLAISNTDENFHYETAVDAALLRGEYERAERIAAGARHASRELSVLRAYALSRMDSLPDRLFAYPQHAGARGLLFEPGEARTTWLTADAMYQYLGNRPLTGETTVDFLKRSCYSGVGSTPILDYYLCTLLLCKQVDTFERELHTFCYVDESSPRAYREALYLYARQHPGREMPAEVSGLAEAYQAYLKQPEAHRDTYWYYYDRIQPAGEE